MHRVAVLGEEDQGLRFRDAFRDMTPKEVEGPLNATGGIFCWNPRFQDYWKMGSAFLVENTKGELRVVTNKHVITEGTPTEEFLHHTSTDTTCYFTPLSILFITYQQEKPCVWVFRRQNTRMYVAFPGQLVGCLKKKDWVYELLGADNFPSVAVEGNNMADIAILKFKDETPESKPLRMVKLENGTFRVLKKGEETFLEIENRGLYRGFSSKWPSHVNKQSCSIYPKRPLPQLYGDTVDILIMDCHNIHGFSGGPVIFQNTEDPEDFFTPCIQLGTGFVRSQLTGRTSFRRSFHEKRSVNLCQRVTDEMLELIEE